MLDQIDQEIQEPNIADQPTQPLPILSLVPVASTVVEGEIIIDLTPPIVPGRFHWQKLLFVLLALLLILASGGITTLLLPLLQPEATVTLTMRQETIHTQTSLALTSLGSRFLPSVQVKQEKTVPTTGTGYQDATPATGTITFYNSATYAQTIEANTLLTAGDGSHVLTNVGVIVPAATPPTEGVAQASAHTVLTGSGSNLPAGAIQGDCCTLDISAYSGVFTGAADAYSFRAVSRQDILNAAAPLTSQTKIEAQSKLSATLLSGEAETAPICKVKTKSNVQPGEAAKQVTIQVTADCQAHAYQEQVLESTAGTMLAQTAQHTLGEGYILSGTPQVGVNPRASTIAVTVSGIYRYVLSPVEQGHLLKTLAGQKTGQAQRYLTKLPGISGETIMSSRDTLPADPSRIHLLLNYPTQ